MDLWRNVLVRVAAVVLINLAASIGAIYVYVFVMPLGFGGMWDSTGSFEILGNTIFRTNVWLGQALILPAWVLVELWSGLRKIILPAGSYMLFLISFWFAMGAAVIWYCATPVHRPWDLTAAYGAALLAGLCAGFIYWRFMRRGIVIQKVNLDIF